MAIGPRGRTVPGRIVGTGISSQTTHPDTIGIGRASGPTLIDRAIRDPAAFFPRAPDITRNIYEAGRPGRVIVRPEDLLALRIELRNLEVTPGTPPKLRKTASGPAYLTLHFPPQAIAEETFFLAIPPKLKPSDAEQAENDLHKNANDVAKPEPSGGQSDAPPSAPPVRARIADESRLVFAVPDGFEIDYTLAAILNAVTTLTPSVAANAKPRGAARRTFKVSDLFNQAAVNALAPKARASLVSFALRSLQIGGMQGDMATLRLRQSSSGAAFQPLRGGVIPAIAAGAAHRKVASQARPAAPGPTTTAIELPWRLILSPHSGTRWQHATAPVRSTATNHTELWHSRLVAPGADGSVIQPPYRDPQRTVRAIWARSGEGIEAAQPPMQGTWPGSAQIPHPADSPFRMPMDDSDRFQISHLSSNFSLKTYEPAPVDTNLMMLTALGGWLDSRGAWEPPGLSVEEWTHRASMARDHYVRIVYRGFLFPFGHRVSLVKVTERRFHNGKQGTEKISGNVAYLRQRMFIIVREHERTYDDPAFVAAHSGDGRVVYSRAFPFSRIKILTQVTPDIDDPAIIPSTIDGRLIFWPHVGGHPFRFQCAATDLDGNRVAFDLPMIFMDNIRACPRTYNTATKTLLPNFHDAEVAAETVANAYAAATDKNWAPLDLQRIALAASAKPGDTALQVERLTFGGAREYDNPSIRALSDRLNRPVFLPQVAEAQARIPALSHLTGSAKSNRLQWNGHYLQFGFNANPAGPPGPNGNIGEVFADVMADSGMALLDFSSQGDRSGGFVQPNMKPKALSRLSGPVMSDVGQFIAGKMPSGAGFPTSLSDLPLPLLFGCIPLGELIDAVASVTGSPEKIPKFASEASNKLESFVNGLVRLFGFVSDLASKPADIGNAAVAVFKATLGDLEHQAAGYAAAQMAPLLAAINTLKTDLDAVAARLAAFADKTINDGSFAPDLAALPTSIDAARATIAQLKTAANAQVAGVSVPSGMRQSILNAAQKLDDFLLDLKTIQQVIASGKTLFAALDAIVGDPNALGTLLADPNALAAKLDDLTNAIPGFRAALDGFHLVDGAPKTAVLNALAAVDEVLGDVADLLQIVAMLTGDTLTIRFDWNPEISSWWFPGVSHSDDPIFRANDKKGFIVAVEAKVKKNGSAGPKISVTCGLKHFDLVLIAPASFIELNFEKIEFSVDSAAKMNVDVLLNDIKFVGPLSFVETLRDLIPLDGFSDPPHLDITTKGIDAGFDVALPSISIGVLSLANLSLGAGFTVPFIGQPLSVRFNFCTREQPFLLTVWLFGGGGFFGVTIDPHGVQILEASFEFGAAISIDLGVASGGVHVMAGIYFRMEKDAASLTGYFRLGGHVSVLGIITASLELYLELRYEFQSGKCVGKAQLTIEISLFIFSGSVTVSCERKFAGSNGDPSLRQMLGFRPDLPLEQELALIDSADIAYAWRDHCEAFA